MNFRAAGGFFGSAVHGAKATGHFTTRPTDTRSDRCPHGRKRTNSLTVMIYVRYHQPACGQDGATTPMAKLRYYDAADKMPAAPAKAKAHTEFLRTGRIDRRRWMANERQYLSYAEGAQQTARKLTTRAERPTADINGSWPRCSPKMVFQVAPLANSPHLGLLPRDRAKNLPRKGNEDHLVLLSRELLLRLGNEDPFLDRISRAIRPCISPSRSSPMPAKDGYVVNRNVRGNGLMFPTQDPKVAEENVADASGTRRSLAADHSQPLTKKIVLFLQSLR